MTVTSDGRYRATVKPPSFGAVPLTWRWIDPDGLASSATGSGLATSYEILDHESAAVGSITFSGAGVELRTAGAERGTGRPLRTASTSFALTLPHATVTARRVTDGPWRRRRDRWDLAIAGDVTAQMWQLVAWMPVLVEHRRRGRRRLVVTGVPGGR